MLGMPRMQNGTVRRAQILPGNIGYLEINAVPPPPMAKPPVDAPFVFLHDTDALILDLRGNGGGSPDTVALYLSPRLKRRLEGGPRDGLTRGHVQATDGAASNELLVDRHEAIAPFCVSTPAEHELGAI
jgi:hypothetical protein